MTSMGGRKRTRSETTDHVPHHPFFISYPKAITKNSTKRRHVESPSQRVKYQSFSPSTDRLDLLYMVEPETAWQKMASYKSFILGGLRYRRDDFVTIAHERTIKRPTPVDVSRDNRRRGDEEWVARILEVRASNANHVYARIHWMYRSSDLPPRIIDKEKIRGQPHDESNMLIFSNHMDIIDVLSVTGPVQVFQWAQIEHGETKNAYFWRQIYDWRDRQLHTFDTMTRHTQAAANPGEISDTSTS